MGGARLLKALDLATCQRLQLIRNASDTGVNEVVEEVSEISRRRLLSEGRESFPTEICSGSGSLSAHKCNEIERRSRERREICG